MKKINENSIKIIILKIKIKVKGEKNDLKVAELVKHKKSLRGFQQRLKEMSKLIKMLSHFGRVGRTNLILESLTVRILVNQKTQLSQIIK